jgi:hypothetical protein
MKKMKSVKDELKNKHDKKTKQSKDQATTDMYDDDIRNVELLIDAHSSDPFEVMYLQTYDDSPMAKEADDIVLRVEVSC